LIAVAAIGILACTDKNPAAPSCTITLSPGSLAFTSAGGTGAVSVSTSPSPCAWTAETSAPWIAILTGASGSGSGTVTYSVVANPASQPREGAVVIGSQVHKVAQDGRDTCAYDVTPLAASVDSRGGQSTIVVSTTASCSWTATTSEPWISIVSGANGEGGGTVTYAVAPYTGTTTRVGVIHVAGHDVQVTQSAPGCSYAVSPQSAAFGPDAAQASIGVSAPAGCAWTASTNDAWLVIVQGTSGEGNGTVIYTIAKQPSSDARAGTIRVAGVDVRIVQSGDTALCQYSVAPVTFSPCMPATTLTTTVTTGSSCPWNASPSASWLTIAAGQTGTGSGVIQFSTSDNYDDPRAGVIMVRWPTVTAGQNVQVAQAGCTYTVLPNAFSIGAAGGSGQFDVYQMSTPNECGGPLQDGCVWTAIPEVTWITVTPGGAVRGDGRVLFTVAANTGGGRTGTIRVRNKTVTITQLETGRLIPRGE
jgi:hypothetical protein